MHEMAVVSDFMDICECYAKKHKAKKINKIKLSIGRLSGVEVHYLKECFEVFKNSRADLFLNANLECKVSDVVILCNVCKKESTLKVNEFLCHFCHKTDFKIISGDEMLVESIEME